MSDAAEWAREHGIPVADEPDETDLQALTNDLLGLEQL